MRDWYGMTPLHRTVVFSQDVRVAELLCQWGADLNAQDVFGNTPLASLCEAFPLGVSRCFEDEDDFLETEWLQVLATRAFRQNGKDHFRTFLLDQKGIKVKNKYVYMYFLFLKCFFAITTNNSILVRLNKHWINV